MSNKENDGVHVSEREFIDTKEVKLGVDLDVYVHNNGNSSKKKGGFVASDLVWAKVKSHPWWPGQIFEPEDASDMGRKHFRSGSYLVAYFGDQTFAWNNETMLKPFLPHFSQMVKQTSKDAFRNAVDSALDEVLRRVEFGLSCHCIANDVYGRLKSQVVENAGIREASSTREGGDRFLTALSFEPVKLVEYVKRLAQGSHVEVDRLEHVIARGQLSAFYRWKGYYHLPEFSISIGSLNNEPNASNVITKGEEDICQMRDDSAVACEEPLKVHFSRARKRKNMSSHSCHSSKKVKHLSDSMLKRSLCKEDNEKETEGKTITPSRRGRAAANLLHDSSIVKDCSPRSQGTAGMSPRDLRPSFSVGESILRVAGQLSQPSPLLKLEVPSHGRSTKAEGGTKRPRRKTKVVPVDYSLDEILSELHFAAVTPLEDHIILSSITSFFSDFRNLTLLDTDMSHRHEESAGKDDVDMFEEQPGEAGSTEIGKGSSASRSEKKASDGETTTISELGNAVDSHCSEKLVSIQQTLSNDPHENANGPKPVKGDVNPTALLDREGTIIGPDESDPNGQSKIIDAEKDQLDEKQQEDSPTALTLKFGDMDSIPSETMLNKIFSNFGPLKESHTEVITKKQCARVVFKRRVDAETAFSSSGKFETFGPSLVCYQLNYAPSPRKSPPEETKWKKKDRSPV